MDDVKLAFLAGDVLSGIDHSITVYVLLQLH